MVDVLHYCGTENIVIAGTQRFLRADCNDDLAGEKSHRYGPSTGNQRIEAWWANLRRSHLTWWINFFKDLVDRGVSLMMCSIGCAYGFALQN